ncbi:MULTISPECIES: DUF3080 family protein [Pseudoalteromonas]|uniref:DUF3080 domain-containing protein n=1 Tax=Pseudoalteromonas luteoviolacea (strain 2ta16) TaxID=1353533 RepID=V4JBN4_PSEL2|nr:MULTISPECIES: DUF3080 family protein [Pseudoalteromonas]ESP92532.1 protein of unknown function (DUF3080) [Pseudoalteromonas luteoviolacea 2ta16]KZN32748.1 hypothetical protein N483_26975 [Pseudoalteromonas luteoviolacea NCIMB 1944]MCG7550573.1 DUF3080 domain-containing protein [Pseudoalteromonas sp. Of7M-16]
MKCKLLLIALSTVLLGCTPAPSDTNQTYTERLGKVFDTDGLSIEALSVLPHSAIDKPKSSYTISVIDLAKLGHCRVSTHIANHNNQLGKLAKPSEQFKYALNFIAYAQACIDDDRTPKDVQQALELARQEKLAQLYPMLAYVFTHEKELTQFFTLTFSEVQRETSQGEIHALEALNTLTSLIKDLNEPNKANGTMLTDALEKLNNNSYVQSLITSTRVQIAWNKTTTAWLSSLALERKVCPAGKNKKRAQVLNNVFQKFYIQDIQAYQSQLAKRLHDIEPHFQTFTDKFGGQDYPNVVTPLIAELKQSAKSHVYWWQNFYKVCKVSPL